MKEKNKRKTRLELDNMTEFKFPPRFLCDHLRLFDTNIQNNI